MPDLGLKCSVRLGNWQGGDVGTLTLHLPSEPVDEVQINAVGHRLASAVDWALDLDAQYRELIQAGRNPQISVPAARKATTRRVQRKVVADYRTLRLGVGELIRPLLLDPPELKVLYPFQRQGVKWLIEFNGGILADDMGLGKTVHVIAALRHLFNQARLRGVLVVCPKGIIANWERELGSWAPELGVAVLTPPAQVREEAWRAVTEGCHVLLTNYEQLRDSPEALRKTPTDLLVADEAHRLRNRSTRVTSGVFDLSLGRFWALSGTPLERDLEDLATLLSLVAPKRFAPTDAKLHPSSLRSQARPYVLRRRKQEVLHELPPVLDTTEMLDLFEGQQKAYRGAIKRYRHTGERGDELALLTRLQALCDIDPESRESCKVERILYLLGRVREHQEKAVVFSYRLDALRELRRRIVESWGVGAAALLVGEMSSQERERAVARFRNDG